MNAVNQEKLEEVKRYLSNGLSTDPYIRNPASDFLVNFPVNEPDNFVKCMITIAHYTTDLSV